LAFLAGRNAEIKHLHHVVGQRPGPKVGIPVVLPGRTTAQIVDNKGVDDIGLEPLTSPVFRIDGKKRRRRKQRISPVSKGFSGPSG
jgi:hypothetical protein